MKKLAPGDSIVVFTGDTFASGPHQPAKVTSVGSSPDGQDSPVSVNCIVEPEGAEPFEMTSVAVHETQPDVVGTGAGWLPA